ncbi:MAG: COX15/CtaA family protein [Micrococcales bacterium]|nr:COX15/CtaA family protein [Micrococcales bacterium]
MSSLADAPVTVPVSADRRLRAVLLINLALETLIVVTGGLVRLTGSGLGCPTWPQCTPGSYVPTHEQAEGFHKYIEFGNRTLTGAVGFAAIAVILAVWKWGGRRRDLTWAGWFVLAGVVAQAVVGGITVRTGLNPAIVAFHFLASMVLVAASAYAYFRATEPEGSRALAVHPLVAQLAYAVCAVGGIVLVLGTIVTGSGPHSGDADEPARLGFDPRSASWLHADAVMLFLGLVVAVWVAARLTGRSPAPGRAWFAVLLVTLAQGAVGYTQYFTGLPEMLVLVHMLGAAALVIALSYGVVRLRSWDDAVRTD